MQIVSNPQTSLIFDALSVSVKKSGVFRTFVRVVIFSGVEFIHSVTSSVDTRLLNSTSLYGTLLTTVLHILVVLTVEVRALDYESRSQWSPPLTPFLFYGVRPNLNLVTSNSSANSCRKFWKAGFPHFMEAENYLNEPLSGERSWSTNASSHSATPIIRNWVIDVAHKSGWKPDVSPSARIGKIQMFELFKG